MTRSVANGSALGIVVFAALQRQFLSAGQGRPGQDQCRDCSGGNEMIRLSKEQTKAYAEMLGIDVPKGKKLAKSTHIADATWQTYGIPIPEREYRFCERRWRLDFAWTWFKPGVGLEKMALEIDGGLFIRGAHSRGKDIIGDHEKANAAVLKGWRLFRCSPAAIKDGSIFKILRQAMGLEPL
jgi:hypothetical protein